jgi:hypothetical protein
VRLRRALAAGLLCSALAAYAQAPPEVPPPAEAQPAAAPANSAQTPEAAPAATAAPPAERTPEQSKPAVPRLPPPKPAAPPAPPPQDNAREAEVAALREEVNRLQSELDAERAAALPPPEEAGSGVPPAHSAWGWLAATTLVALGAGFLLGWRLLDRRIRRKYGGLRIY